MWNDKNVLLTVAGLAVVLLAGLTCAAQEPLAAEPAQEDSDWSYQQTYADQPEPRAIVQYKAQVRASQRMARMSAMRWYGMYNERPTASPTPFTALYSPVWQMPGGRPYAWHHRGFSSLIVLPR